MTDKFDAVGSAWITQRPQQYLVYAESRDGLIEFTDANLGEWGNDPDVNYIYMYLQCSCGKGYQYKTREDVPSENVDCPCGQHIITYGAVTA